MNKIEEYIRDLIEVTQDQSIDQRNKEYFFYDQIATIQNNKSLLVEYLVKVIQLNDFWHISNGWNKNYVNYYQLPLEDLIDPEIGNLESKDVLILIQRCSENLNPNSNILYSTLLFEAARYGYIDITPEILGYQNQIHSRHVNPTITKAYEIYFPENYKELQNGSDKPRYNELSTGSNLISGITTSKFGGIIPELKSLDIHKVISINTTPKEIPVFSVDQLTIAMNFNKACESKFANTYPYFVYHDQTGLPYKDSSPLIKREIEYYNANPIVECEVLIKEVPRKYLHHKFSENEWRIAGEPCWLQGSETVQCEKCKKNMVFVIQLPSGVLIDKDGGPIMYGNYGMTYGFWCDLDRIMGYIWQDT